MLYDLVFSFLIYFMLIVMVLIGVAFFTLFERKILGYIQCRKGPNKSGFLGLAQPFSDAIKLFSKELVLPSMSNFILYYFSPVFMMFISLLMWASFPFYFYLMEFNYSVLYIICLSSISVYGVMMAGWSSNSNYSLLGSLRSIAQTISYEVSFILIFLSVLFLFLCFNLSMFIFFQYYIWLMLAMIPLGLMFFVSMLAETNRTPFDLSEGESELVSGFNVEYSGGLFALIFLAEYSSIMFMSFFFSLIFLGGNFSDFNFYYKVLLLILFWIWVRGTLPRIRYDQLMSLAWTVYLPSSLNFIFFYMNFMFLVLIN